MAFVRETYPTYLLVQYRDAAGKQRSWRCLSKENFDAFRSLERAHKKTGTAVPDPAVLFGEAPRPASAKTSKKHAAAAKRAERERRAAEKAAAMPMPTAASWVGEPHDGKDGEYFKHAKTMTSAQKKRYASLLRNYGGHFEDKPLDKVTYDDAYKMMLNMIVCDACVERAVKAKRKDLLADKGKNFRADKRPWDDPEGVDAQASRCRNADGENTHLGGNKRSTVISNLWLMRALWRVAEEAGHLGHIGAFKDLKAKPFEKVGDRVPMFAEQQTNDDLAEALGHTHLERLRLGFPEWLQASVRTGAYGLMRRSEFMGLERSMITWPTLPEHHGQATLVISHTYIIGAGGVAERRPWGKTPGSTREVIHLSRLATDELRAHMVRWRSTANPTVCQACRDEVGECEDAKTNPHRGCDLANDAPVWWDFIKNQRVAPDDYSETYFSTACVMAELTPEAIGFKPTPKLLRATGATLLIDAGVPIAQVAKMGRWENEDILRRHYHRMRDTAKTEAARSLDTAARGELGLDGVAGASLEERVRFQERRIEVLEQMVARRDAVLAGMGVAPSEVDAVRRPEVADLWPKRDHALADIDRIRELAGSCSNRREMFDELGITPGASSRLNQVAAEHGIELPTRWARSTEKPPPSELIEALDADRLRGLCETLPTLNKVCQAIGVLSGEPYKSKLMKKAAELGVELPAVQPRKPADRSALEDVERIRELAETQPSMNAILVSLGIRATQVEYEALRKVAAANGIKLPATRAGRPPKQRSDAA